MTNNKPLFLLLLLLCSCYPAPGQSDDGPGGFLSSCLTLRTLNVPGMYWTGLRYGGTGQHEDNSTGIQVWATRKRNKNVRDVFPHSRNPSCWHSGVRDCWRCHVLVKVISLNSGRPVGRQRREMPRKVLKLSEPWR